MWWDFFFWGFRVLRSRFLYRVFQESQNNCGIPKTFNLVHFNRCFSSLLQPSSVLTLKNRKKTVKAQLQHLAKPKYILPVFCLEPIKLSSSKTNIAWFDFIYQIYKKLYWNKFIMTKFCCPWMLVFNWWMYKYSPIITLVS